MYPDTTFLGRTFPTYSLMAITGMIIGLLYIVLHCKIYKLKIEDSIYIYVLGIVGAIIGAKIVYLLTVFPKLIHDVPLICSDFSTFKNRYLAGGMVFYGGLFGGLLVAYLTAKGYNDRLPDYYPVLLPSLAIVSGFGRIGCFLTGCCYGKETISFIGLMFNRSYIAPHNVKLIPVQLFESAFDFFLCFIMIRICHIDKKKMNALKYYLVLYASFRFINEFFRGDSIRGIEGYFSTSQWISIAIIVYIMLIHHYHIVNKITKPNDRKV